MVAIKARTKAPASYNASPEEANKDVQIKRASSHSEDLLEELALDDTPELREIKSEI